MTKIINTEEYNEKIVKGKEKAVIDFYADWCGPCKMMSPIFEELEAENSDECSFYKMNVDNDGAVAASLGIVSIPTIVFFRDGIAQMKTVGLTSKDELLRELKNL